MLKYFMVVLLCFFLVFCPESVCAERIAVIVNTENFEQFSLLKVQNIFTGKTTEYSSEKTITVVLTKDDEIRQQFNTEVLKQTNRQNNTLWKELVFTGKVNPPLEKTSIRRVVEYVARNETAISYVPIDFVTNDVRIVYVIEDY